jgi:AcrR family transcriptional regulator
MTATPSLRERQLQLREEAILDAAHDLMAQQGFSSMSMDDVAARVGISKATLYHHFPSKDDLALNVILRAIRLVEARLQALDPAVPAIQRIEQAVHSLLEHRFGGDARYQIERPSLHPALHSNTRFQEQKDRLALQLVNLIEEAQAVGDIPGHFNSHLLAKLIMAAIHNPDYAELLAAQQCSFAEFQATITAILVNGLRTATANPRQ